MYVNIESNFGYFSDKSGIIFLIIHKFIQIQDKKKGIPLNLRSIDRR